MARTLLKFQFYWWTSPHKNRLIKPLKGDILVSIQSDIKQRREERIRDLLNRQNDQQLKESGIIVTGHESNLRSYTEVPASVPERDPELVWKQEAPHRWNVTDPGHKRHSFGTGLLWRTLIAGGLFLFAWGLSYVEKPWAYTLQDKITASLLVEMEFAAVQAWYETYFGGTPSFIPIFEVNQPSAQKADSSSLIISPLQGRIVQSFAVNMTGVEIEPKTDSVAALQVKSVATGRVIKVTKEQLGGITVVVQHAGDMLTTYGHLAETRLQANDWLEVGDLVGQLSASDKASATLFFSIKEGEQYIDPEDVIPLD